MASTIRILFGTETGNAEDTANDLGDELRRRGWHADVVDMDDYEPTDLPREALLLIITSTFGNGDPPVNAEALMEHLRQDAPDLGGLRFGVCALGDSTYPRFAQCGRDFDGLLEERGGERVIPLQVCDADFEDYVPAFQKSVIGWLEEHGAPFEGASAGPERAASETAETSPGLFGGIVSAVRSLFGGAGEPSGAEPPAMAPVTEAAADQPAPSGPWTAKNPFAATITARRKLSGAGSGKETMHYELSLAGSGIDFAPGDSFGVHPHNDPVEVDRLLEALDLDGTVVVVHDGEQRALRELLLERLDLQNVTKALAQALGRSGGPAGAAVAEGDDALRAWRGTRFVWEAASEHPDASIGAQELVDALRRLQPRLYSVANSPLVDAESVHFTVETLRYAHDGFARTGVASTWLCDRVAEGAPVPVHLVPGTHFRLPEAPDADIICVGPGTGVAPFRGFLQHREARGDSGRTWLFFGHQTSACDALYADELAGFEERGVLTHLTCAWSRDQEHKVYVQHRMAEHGAEVYAWLDGGGLLYVCGDKQHMAGDVRSTLVAIAAEHGGLDAAGAEAWVAALEDGGRYRVDVY